MISLLLDLCLLESQEELRALCHNGVKSFSDLLYASDKEPRVLKPVLNRYIQWFNKNVAPKAVKIVTA